MSEVSLGTVYDFNKKGYEALEDKTSEQCDRIFGNFVLLNFLHKNKFHMLLCKERHDYTIFHTTGNHTFNFAGKELRETCENRGSIISVETTEDGIGYEIWLRINDEAFCYLLFPYDYGIVEV